jgi:hypothetical protein
MGNACNCVSKGEPKEEMNLAGDAAKKKEAKKNNTEKDHDESNLMEDEGEEKADPNDPEMINAAIKIQVGKG